MKFSTFKAALVAAAIAVTPAAYGQDASSLSELLRQIEQGQRTDSAEARQREAEFNSRDAC